MHSLGPDVTRKLIGILGRLGSDHDGERAAAGLLASRLLRDRGLTWSDLIGSAQRIEFPPEIARAAEEARAARAAQRGAGDDLTLALRHMDRLKNWEQQFVTSVAIRTKRSPKQNQVIREIAAALRARGLG